MGPESGTEATGGKEAWETLLHGQSLCGIKESSGTMKWGQLYNFVKYLMPLCNCIL